MQLQSLLQNACTAALPVVRCTVCMQDLQRLGCYQVGEGFLMRPSPDVARWNSAAVAAACTAILAGSAAPWNSQCSHTYPAAKQSV